MLTPCSFFIFYHQCMQVPAAHSSASRVGVPPQHDCHGKEGGADVAEEDDGGHGTACSEVGLALPDHGFDLLHRMSWQKLPEYNEGHQAGLKVS